MNNPLDSFTVERLEQLADHRMICKMSWEEEKALGKIALAAKQAKDVAAAITPTLQLPDGWIAIPEKLTEDWLFSIIPAMARCRPLSHDEYDYNGRNRRFVDWLWGRLIYMSPKLPSTPKPE